MYPTKGIIATWDMEFTSLHQNTTLISLGIVYSTGHKFYAEFNDYDKNQVDDWLQENVINRLFMVEAPAPYSLVVDNTTMVYGDRVSIANALKRFHANVVGATEDNKINFWGDCLAWDWMLLCQLLVADGKQYLVQLYDPNNPDCPKPKSAIDLPKNIYYIPNELCTYLKLMGVDPDINREEFANMDDTEAKHNALHDAEVIYKCLDELNTRYLSM